MTINANYDVLENAIKRAGEKAQAFRKDGLSITVKGRQDFVSQADVLVENELKEVIKSLYPDDAFLGEESGLTTQYLSHDGASSRGVWVIDPIDGTTNYLQNMDYWCVSVAFVKDNKVEWGCIYAPDRNEFFIARSGQGAYLNGKRLNMKEPLDGHAILGLGRSNRTLLQNYLDLMVMLDRNNIEYRRFGAGALMLAHVASGLVHGYYEAHLNSWDALAGILLIEEAGGTVSDFLENDGLLNGNPILAATPILWRRLQAEDL
ncbi:inositol monophosphatase [Marinomonas sp. 15G1-11]|uniref:Inositol-1-monophosphatase n=1 Tax=Marinomonas phaeophyticola TaxID=3004091 RepID=A0ABT4JX12_9GAMM|nr:inositol monophosphatase [Marinomonas sp. 15G1-11]MCZ2722771.1 inositol monophosphatase [Marinomonas sp. 15G1-11]